MILASFLVKSPIVNTKSPTIGHSCWNQLIVLVPCNSDVRHHIKDGRIQPPLGLPYRLGIILQMYPMHAYGRIGSRMVSKCPPNVLFVAS